MSCIALAWLTRTLSAARNLPQVPNLILPAFDLTPTGAPTVTVVIPACNEQADIRACLESLLAQDYPVQIIAVDDRSTDRTGAIIDSLSGPNLIPIHITSLPAGWLGKTHAMASAAAQSTSDILLFSDADIVFRPDTLRRALAYAEISQADHLVIGPTTLIHRWDEAAMLSFFQIFGLLAARPWKVADPAARDAIGIGAFNLVRRTAYERIGGFEALRMEIVEDLNLARRIKRFGLRQRFAFGRGLVSLHWASGVNGIVRVMTKNTFAAFNYHPSLLVLGCIGLTFLCIVPYVALSRPALAIPAAAAVASIVWAYRLLSRLDGHPAWNAALAPFAAAIFIFTLIRSMTITLVNGGVEWRGTFYPLAELRANAAPIFPKK